MHGARPLRSTRRLANLAGARPGWYTIRNQKDGPALVSIYDEIGFLGTSASDFLAELRTITGDIELHVNSPGGDVFDGIAIYNTLKQRSGQVHVIVDGLAASAASFIAQAATPGDLEMAPHSQMMIHDGFAMAIGNAGDMRELADQLDQVSDEIASIYSDRTGKPASHWRDKMRSETWMTAQQAVAEGLADKVYGQDARPGDWDMSVFSHYTGQADPAGPVVVNADGNHAPMRGSHSHSHPSYTAASGPHSHDHEHDGDASHQHSHAQAAESKAERKARKQRARNAQDMGDGWVQDPDGRMRYDPDGDGDDDSTAAGDTDHDYWSEDGKSLKPVPPKPKRKAAKVTTAFSNADVDRSAWDGPKAMSAAAKSDDPAAFYKAICAGRRAGDPDKQSSWALPYRYTPSSPPNAAGVRNALARLPQTQGLTNADEAKSKLQGLMKQIDPDYSPDGKIDPVLLAEAFALSLERSR